MTFLLPLGSSTLRRLVIAPPCMGAWARWCSCSLLALLRSSAAAVGGANGQALGRLLDMSVVAPRRPPLGIGAVVVAACAGGSVDEGTARGHRSDTDVGSHAVNYIS